MQSHNIFMKYEVMMGQKIIGETDLGQLDRGMGIARGDFFPTADYASVASTFKLFAKSYRETDETLQDQILKEYYKKRDALGLSLRKSTGPKISVEWIHIIDFTDDPAISYLEIEINVIDLREL